MSLVSRFGPVCKDCHKPHRTTYGSMQWHARNDPAGGYCHCDLDTLLNPPSAKDVDEVACSVCNGSKVVGIPGSACPMCRGTGVDEPATAARRLARAEKA